MSQDRLDQEFEGRSLWPDSGRCLHLFTPLSLAHWAPRLSKLQDSRLIYRSPIQSMCAGKSMSQDRLDQACEEHLAAFWPGSSKWNLHHSTLFPLAYCTPHQLRRAPDTGCNLLQARA